MLRKYTILLAVLLFVLAVVLSFQWKNAVSERGEVGRETAENDLSKARSTQRSKKSLERGSKEMSSQEAFNRLWEMGERESFYVGGISLSYEEIIGGIRRMEERRKAFEELFKLMNYSQAYQLFSKFHSEADNLGLQNDVKWIYTKGVVMAAFYRMSELNSEKTLAIFEQEEGAEIRYLLARSLAAGWSEAKPYEALAWWKSYALGNPDSVPRLNTLRPFEPSLDQDLYESLSKVDYEAALRGAKSEDGYLILVNALIGLVKGLSPDEPMEPIAETLLGVMEEKEGNELEFEMLEDLKSEGLFQLQDRIALKWLEVDVDVDVDGALSWHRLVDESRVEKSWRDNYFRVDGIDGDPFGVNTTLINRWATEYPDSFLSWVRDQDLKDQYPKVIGYYYGGEYTDKAMAFIEMQEGDAIRRNLFQMAVIGEVVEVNREDVFDVGEDGIMEIYDQGLENLKKSNLSAADKEVLTTWLLEERKKHISGE